MHVKTTNILKDENSELDIDRYLIGKEKLNASFTAFATEQRFVNAKGQNLFFEEMEKNTNYEYYKQTHFLKHDRF